MANWNNLKTAINNIIKTNGNQTITGQVMQNALNNIISNIGANATFAGVAVPSTNPGAPDGPVFYFAFQNGTYSNFGGTVINKVDTVKIFKWNGSEWSIIDTGLPNNSKITEMVSEISDNYLSELNKSVETVNDIAESLIDQVEDIENSLATHVNKAVSSINTSVDKLAGYVDKSIKDLSKSIDSSIETVYTQLNNQKDEIEGAQNNAIETITNKEQEILSNFNKQQVTVNMLSEGVIDLINSSGGGTINNLPDNEDIMSYGTDNPVLKFANRKYVASSFNGKGYKILRKGIDNSLSQADIAEINTVFEIRYDFDLNNETITIPEGGYLLYNGGSLNNCILNLSDYCDFDDEVIGSNVEIQDSINWNDYYNSSNFKQNKAINSTYYINARVWNIKSGFPTPSNSGARYTVDDYKQARHTAERIQMAVNYAHKRSYKKVIIEKGDYAFCFYKQDGYSHRTKGSNSQVIIKDMDFDCNNSRFKFILDSDNANPYGVSYNVRGYSEVIFALLGDGPSIHDGEFIGEMVERSYSTDNDRRQEWSNAITLWDNVTNLINADNKQFIPATINARLYNLNMHHFGGDAVCFSSWDSSNNVYTWSAKDAIYTLGTIDKNGTQQDSDTNVVSSAFQLSLTEEERAYNNSAMLIYSSDYYSRLGNTNVAGCYIAYYDNVGNFLGKSDFIDYYQPIPFPKDCYTFKIELINQADYILEETKNSSLLTIGWAPRRGGYNILENSIISFCQRGGLFLGGHFNIIRNNWFFSTGYSPFSQGTGTENAIFDYKKIQPYIDNTNYCINMEDDPGMGAIIENNRFEYAYNTLLLAGNGFTVRNNKYIHIGQSIITTYWSKNVIFENNIIEGDQKSNLYISTNTAWKENAFYIRNNIGNNVAAIINEQLPLNNFKAYIINNKFLAINTAASIKATFNPASLILSNNDVVGCNIYKYAKNENIQLQIDNSPTSVFEKCSFTRDSTSWPTLENKTFKDCTFDARTGKPGDYHRINIGEGNQFTNCLFKDVIYGPVTAKTEMSQNITFFDNCIFYNLFFGYNIKYLKVIFRNCRFIYDNYLPLTYPLGNGKLQSMFYNLVSSYFIFDSCFFDFSQYTATTDTKLSLNINENSEPKFEKLIFFYKCSIKSNIYNIQFTPTTTVNMTVASSEDFIETLPPQPIYMLDKYKDELGKYYNKFYWDRANNKYVKLVYSEVINDKRVNTYE